ncbi:hypothetical protein ACA910_018612 [Epithemia clementina (nom. ined.)]
MRQVIYRQILERNGRETDPFRSIHESNRQLSKQVDALQKKLELSEREISRLQLELEDSAFGVAASGNNNGTTTGGVKSGAAAAALKNEARLRDKLEKLQDEFNSRMKQEAMDRADALKTAKRVSELQDMNSSQEVVISDLREQIQRQERATDHLRSELEDAKSRTKLAEKQYDGLKITIRTLQEENDEFKKENRVLEGRLVGDKEKMVDEMNALTEMVESLKRENNLLRDKNAPPKSPESKRNTGWFGTSFSGGGGQKENKESSPPSSSSKQEAKDAAAAEKSPKFGNMGVVLPSMPRHKVAAHNSEGMCIRYDGSGNNLVATASGDSTVKIWDTSTGTVRATLYGSNGHATIACDMYGTVVVGAGSDKTCRVWNHRTQRMIHHLVGHQHKVTSVRLCSNGEAVLTASADRSLKVWDISRQTYKQTTTLRHGSTSHCVDVGSDSFSAVSGHLDGGLRFWDLRTGGRTAEIADMHEGGISSVCFSPVSSTQVLTNGMDSCLKLVDVRTGSSIHTFRHAEFSTPQSYSMAVLSPDGRYAAAGSGSNGSIFVWDAVHGSLKAKLSGHECGVCAIDWGRGEQQVATIDRRGNMILWA